MYRYIVSADTGASYQLTSEHADATFTVGVADKTLSLIDTGKTGEQVWIKGDRLSIKRACISNNTASVNGNGTLAAKLTCKLVRKTTGEDTDFDPFVLPLSKWGVWEDKTIVLVRKDGPSDAEYTIVLDKDGQFNLWDFNIQDDLKDMYVNPVLELDISEGGV